MNVGVDGGDLLGGSGLEFDGFRVKLFPLLVHFRAVLVHLTVPFLDAASLVPFLGGRSVDLDGVPCAPVGGDVVRTRGGDLVVKFRHLGGEKF